VVDVGFGFAFKKTQADIVAKIMSDENVKFFKVRNALEASATDLLKHFTTGR
jgi:hypothetical protein